MGVDKAVLLRRKFELAVEHARSGAGGALDAQTQLAFYALFKQATAGECREPAPSRLSVAKYAKHQAWSELGTLSSEQAMRRYLRAMDRQDPRWVDVVRAAQSIKLRSKL
jgi:diazepam-binding inhibitor (GABA receptor modulating acyl-CoA-binding protein)